MNALCRQYAKDLWEYQSELVKSNRFKALGCLSRPLFQSLGASLEGTEPELGSAEMTHDGSSFDKVLSTFHRSQSFLKQISDLSASEPLFTKNTIMNSWLHEVVETVSFPEGIHNLVAFGAHVNLLVNRAQLKKAVFALINNAIESIQKLDKPQGWVRGY